MAKTPYAHVALKKALSRAVHLYNMIADGDRIVVGLSGGKDSMTLLHLLLYLKQKAPIDFYLKPVYIDPGFAGGFGGELTAYVTSLGLDLHVELTDYGLMAHSDANTENPCFLCARLRRKRLFELARKFGCTKLALGHHKDDLIETFIMNILYAGEVSSMLPYQQMFKGAFTVIRPLAYAESAHIKRYVSDMQLPVYKNPCPSAGITKRQEVRDILNDLYYKNRKVRGNIFHAMSNIKLEYLLKKDRGGKRTH